MQSKTYVISFGNNDYYLRLSNYVVNKISKNNLNCIPLVYSKDDLPDGMVEFCDQHTKGYGLFMWKPYIVQKTFEIMNDNDVLFYIDGRSYYTGKKIPFLEELVYNSSLDGVFWSMDGLFENQYSKGDFFAYLGVTDSNIKFSPQIASTFFLLKKGLLTKELVSRWNSFMNSNRLLFVNDSSNFPNEIGFITNRHCQSILSILIKSNKELEYKKITYKDFNNIIKPHSLPHEFEYSYIFNYLPSKLIRIIHTAKKLSISQVITYLYNKIKHWLIE